MRAWNPWSVGPSILMYHSVSNNSNDPFSVAAENFREQIHWLAKNNFEIVSLEFMLQLLQERDYSNLCKRVVITFDDGYRDFVANALPILLNYGVTATVFVVTGLIGGRADWHQYADCAQLMTEDEVRYVKEKGISLGSHTSMHANLTLVDNKELQSQLNDSYDVLVQFGESFCTFSYPWGQWSNQVVDAVKSSGYECALAVGEHTRLIFDNRFCLPRITIRRDMNIRDFQHLLKRTNLDKATRRAYRMLRERM